MKELNKFEIIQQVAALCHSRLWDNKEAVDYLYNNRKLTKETIEKFQIGLFPQDLRELFSMVDATSLREAGLIKHASRSPFQTWDLVLPVQDAYSNYIALVGRTRLSEEKRYKINISKYYNSIYSKGQHLFGLNLAKKSILENNIVYVVEGHYDVIMPHQHGFTNVVAVCSSHLSTRQLVLLSRYTDNIVILFDNEPTAIEVALKIVHKKQQKGLTLVAKNPFPKDIKDLDEYLRKYSLDSLKTRLRDVKNLTTDEFSNICPAWE